MLFLGSKKYPKEDYYEKIVKPKNLGLIIEVKLKNEA
jgi:hypothetical protein